MRRLFGFLLILAAVTPAAPSNAVAVTVGRYSLPVDGQTAYGWLAYPTSGTPTTLLVVGHGCCGKPDQSATVAYWASTYGAVAVAMDYRGPGHWDVWTGHRDLMAATEALQQRWPSIATTVIWGLSMGGTTTGMAVATKPHLFDYWVDTFGSVDLLQTYALFATYPGITPQADVDDPTGSWIAQECGGTPATHPGAYLARSPVYLADRMKGIKRAYITHGVGDALVPLNQSRQMATNLVAHGIPVTLETVLTRAGGVQGPWLPHRDLSKVVLPAPYGPAAHDQSVVNVSARLVGKLLSGQEQDAGYAHREWYVDVTTGTRWPAPPV